MTNKKSDLFYKHNKKKISDRIFAYLLVFIALNSIENLRTICCSCRNQDRDECEKVCTWNATTSEYLCNLRAVVILPNNTNVEASLPKVSFI